MRELNWDGARNVRDLGGWPTPFAASGRTSAGRVARGPRREALTPAGWEAALRWGLRAVVDLRNADERGRREADPPAKLPASVAVIERQLEDQTDPEFVRRCLPILDLPQYWVHHVRLQPERIRGALEAIAATGPGVLVHCSAGRDRTGLISALLLSNAGVSPGDVAADYAASALALSGEPPGTAPAQQGNWASDRVEATLALALPEVERFAASAGATFDALGVSVQARRTLRELLM